MNPWLIAGLVAVPLVAAVAVIFMLLFARSSSSEVDLGNVTVEEIDGDIVAVLEPVEVLVDAELDATIAAVEAVDGVASVVYSPSPVVQGIVPDAPTLAYGEDLLFVTLDDGAVEADVIEEINAVRGILGVRVYD